MEKLYSYSQQPTLLIGLGGFGSDIVDRIYARVKDTFNISAFSIDIDVNDARNLVNIPEQHIISIAQRHTLFECLNYLPDAKVWFPNNSLLFGYRLTNGAGQVRAVARLAYELSLKEQRFDTLLTEVSSLAEECVKRNCPMRVSIVSTLVGGTASGIFIQVALLVREHISKYFPKLNTKIHGELILPSIFSSLYNFPKSVSCNLESNAYAALKELNAINEHFFSNTPSVELKYGYFQSDSDKTFVDALPYDYCFLYDLVNPVHNFSKLYIENAITERLFSASANNLNDAFADNLRLNVRKRSGNLYSTIYMEKLPVNSSIFDSKIFRSIISRTSTDKEKRIFSVCSPQKLDIDTALFSQDTIFREKIDPSAPEIFVTELCFGIEISEIEKLRLKSGQYYTSYHSLTERLPTVITPHLNKNWHEELRDIGESIDVINGSD